MIGWRVFVHHPIFEHYQCWSGIVPAGRIVNFLGILTRSSYFNLHAVTSEDISVATEYPPFDEEYFEWIDVLESVYNAQDRFTMIELGAGWGRWMTAAFGALRQLKPEMPYTLVGVEAEPTHF